MRVDQFIPSFSPYDAIGNHVLELRRALRSAGIGSDIYYEAIDPVLRRHARPYTEYAEKSSGRVILYHASTHSEMAQWLIAEAAQGARVLVNYHNITPAEFFDFWLPEAASSMRMARQQLASLVPITELGIGDSTYNQAELDALGYAKTTRCGLMVDLQRFHDEPDARVLQSLRPAAGAGGTHWLFVGRVAPNKSQHDVVAAFAVYRKLFDPEARLSLIGSRTGLRYRRAIDKLLASSTRSCSPTTGPPTCSSVSPGTKDFVCRSSRPWSSGCRCSPWRPRPSPRRSGMPPSWSTRAIRWRWRAAWTGSSPTPHCARHSCPQG
jgi:glycosyltransferase involved in cell wall biosynthesis